MTLLDDLGAEFVDPAPAPPALFVDPAPAPPALFVDPAPAPPALFVDPAPAPPVESEREDGPLRSVSIAMGVLGLFEREPELGATAVAAELGIAKSTASRMLAALAASDMLERTPAGRYRLGLRLFEIGQLAVDRLMLRELALPVLGELREMLGETAQLAVPVGADVLYIDRLEGTGAGTRFHSELYRRGPGHSSSAAKAIAAYNPSMARAILARGFERLTPFTIVDPNRYRQVLRQVRIDGYAASREEHTLGMSSIAAPVVVARGERTVAVAALSIVGGTTRVLGARKVVMVQSIRRAAASVSAALAHCG